MVFCEQFGDEEKTSCRKNTAPAGSAFRGLPGLLLFLKEDAHGSAGNRVHEQHGAYQKQKDERLFV